MSDHWSVYADVAAEAYRDFLSTAHGPADDLPTQAELAEEAILDAELRRKEQRGEDGRD